MDDARRAIASALKRLDGRDAFLLIAFDYELLTSSDDLELATPEAVKKACKFILRAHDCHSPGNIFTPLDLVSSNPTSEPYTLNPSPPMPPRSLHHGGGHFGGQNEGQGLACPAPPSPFECAEHPDQGLGPCT